MCTDLKVWLDHFEYHATRRCVMPEGKRLGLRADERRLIAASIATFQRYSEVGHLPLLHAARAYDQGPMLKIVELLIAEKQHHAHLLNVFMTQHGLPQTAASRWAGLFHGTTPDASFESHLASLATTDLIGKVYLRALEASTGCRQLRALCRMLVADQLAHVGFESDVLRSMNAQHGPVVRCARSVHFRARFLGATLSAWLAHEAVLRAADYSVSTFIRACSIQHTFYLEPPLKSIAPTVTPPIQ